MCEQLLKVFFNLAYPLFILLAGVLFRLFFAMFYCMWEITHKTKTCLNSKLLKHKSSVGSYLFSFILKRKTFLFNFLFQLIHNSSSPTHEKLFFKHSSSHLFYIASLLAGFCLCFFLPPPPSLNKFSARVDGDTHSLLFNAVLGREHTNTPAGETSPSSSNDVLPTIPTCLRQVRSPDVEKTDAEISDTDMLEAYNACVNSFAIGDHVFIQQQEQQ